MMTPHRPRVAISRCLLGEAVRHDGRHKRNALVLDTLGDSVEWVPVCPEVEVGMGVPREPVHLVVGPGPGQLALVGVESGQDWTTRMDEWAGRRIRELATLRIAGFVLKQGSPSCGPDGVPGLFARLLREAMPDVPIEDEGRLADCASRVRFLALVGRYHRARCLSLP